MTPDRAHRHVCARQPAAARRVAGVPLRAAGAAVSRRGSTARPSCSTAAIERGVGRRAPRSCAPDGLRWTYARARRASPTGSRTCWSRTWGSFPATACCCALRTIRCMAACWFAVMKAGGIAVGTMPLLRASELIRDHRQGARSRTRCATRGLPTSSRLRAVPMPDAARRWRCSTTTAPTGSTRACARQAGDVRQRRHGGRRRRADRFTSGTTGQPKGTMHFHRDVIAICDCWPRSTLRASARRSLHRQPAARVHVRPGRAAAVSAARRRGDAAAGKGAAGRAAAGDRRASRRRCCSPRRRRTARWRRARRNTTSRRLRKCVSAGEALPAATRSAVEGRDRHRDHRRHRRDRAAAHLHLARRGAREARRDGQADPGLSRLRDGRRRASRCRRAGRPARREGPDRLPLPRRRAPGGVRAGRLELHGRRLPRRRRRLFPLPGAHRRHDHQRRLQHRRTGGRGRAAAAPGGRRMRRGRRAGRGARADRQGVRRAEAGLRRADEAMARELQDHVKRTSRRTSIRARSSSSHACRAPRPASCSASGCGRCTRRGVLEPMARRI